MLKRAVNWVALGVLGALVATIGAGAHRASGFLGVSLALALVATAGLFAKAWESWTGFVVYAALWGAATVVFAGEGPANSVLVQDDLRGRLWIFGGTVMISLVAAVPRFVLVGSRVAP
jgi:hypothetical protein